MYLARDGSTPVVLRHPIVTFSLTERGWLAHIRRLAPEWEQEQARRLIGRAPESAPQVVSLYAATTGSSGPFPEADTLALVRMAVHADLQLGENGLWHFSLGEDHVFVTEGYETLGDWAASAVVEADPEHWAGPWISHGTTYILRRPSEDDWYPLVRFSVPDEENEAAVLALLRGDREEVHGLRQEHLRWLLGGMEPAQTADIRVRVPWTERLRPTVVEIASHLHGRGRVVRVGCTTVRVWRLGGPDAQAAAQILAAAEGDVGFHQDIMHIRPGGWPIGLAVRHPMGRRPRYYAWWPVDEVMEEVSDD